MGAIRGAICASNNVQDISEQSVELIKQILEKNNLTSDDVDAIIFTATVDLDACYPAEAVRKHFDMTNTAFMCVQEMYVKGSLDHYIRTCVFTSKLSQNECKHCYIGQAKNLRKDID
ncbi:MAG: chorismate mutase [Clostridia bacterium]|nr:chorismate mutase [Clostridia bacterium]